MLYCLHYMVNTFSTTYVPAANDSHSDMCKYIGSS